MTPLGRVLRRSHLPALDGLRAVAVGLVILSHGGVEMVPGDLGVTAFFVLSGFLITWLLVKEQGRTGDVSLKGFYLRRSLRIFPAYFAFVGVSWALDRVLGSPWSAVDVTTALTYTINYRNAFLGHEGPIAHAWSLAIEEQFYLLWPLAFLALGTRPRTRWVLGGVIVAVCAWRSALYLGAGAPAHYVYNAFDTRADALAIGCLLALLTTSEAFLGLAARAAARPWYPLPVVGLLLVSRTMLGEGWHYSAGFTVDALLMCTVIVQCLQLADAGAWSVLDTRLAAWLGALSYPLYLWHSWGLSLADNLTRSTNHTLNLVVGILLSVALASASYYGLERHFLRLKDRLSARAAVPAPAPEAPVAVAAGEQARVP